VESFARLVVLAIGAALVVALINEGPGGPTRWLKAKFLGEVDAGPTAAQQAARRITNAGIPVTAQDIQNAPPLSPIPPRTTARRPTTPRTTGGAVAVR
jgi:hypothetical protein